MPVPRPPALWPRLLAGLVAGGAIALVDHLALTGRINAVVVVALLLCAGSGLGSLWHWRAWPAVITVWTAVVAVHVVKHVAGLAGTLQPDTWESIRSMAAFTLAVCGAGYFGGVLMRVALSD